MFTWFDITILTIITISSILGIRRGIIKLVIGLLGFISSIILTTYLYPYLNKIIEEYLVEPIRLAIISGIISYIISLIVCSLLTHKLLSILSIIRGGITDRILGLTAGFLRGALISLLLFASIAVVFTGSYLEAKTIKDIIHRTTNDKYPIWLKKSLTTPYLEELNKNLINIFLTKKLKTSKS